MPGKEKGTARWADPSELNRVIEKDFFQNVLFTQTERLSTITRKTRKNLNQLIVGGSGAGKSRFFAKPNIMQLNTSFIITDPSGDLLRDTGVMLEEAGYEVKVFNLIDMTNSDFYNPFKYIKKESDVLQLINNLIKNTGSGGNDPFWEKAETMLLQAVFFYILEKGKPHEQNFAMALKLLQLAEPKEDDEDHISPFDKLFIGLEEEKPNHIAVKQYKNFKMAAGKTTKSILIAVASRLAPFAINDLVELTSKDTLNLDEIGDKKTALFIVIPDVDDTFNFMVAMLYSQMFSILYYVADFKGYVDEKGKLVKGRLKYHVRIIADEFANIGTIPNFEKLIATMRRREISVSIILQNMAQIKNIYEKNWESITGNCDSFLFLGGNEWETLKYVSEMLGTDTIDTRTSGKSLGKQGSSSLNYQKDGRELMKADELKNDMPDDECILFIRGFHPFKSKKIILEKHPNYKKLGDVNDDYIFELSAYKEQLTAKLKNKLKENIQEAETVSSPVPLDNNKKVFVDLEESPVDKDALFMMFINLEKQYANNPEFIKIRDEVISLHKANALTEVKFSDILGQIKTRVIDQNDIDYYSGEKNNTDQGSDEENIRIFFEAFEDKYKNLPQFPAWQANFEQELQNGTITIPEDFLHWAEFVTNDIKESAGLENLAYQIFIKIAEIYKNTPQFKELHQAAKDMFENKTYTHSKFIHLIHKLEDEILESTIDMEILENNMIE